MIIPVGIQCLNAVYKKIKKIPRHYPLIGCYQIPDLYMKF